MNQLKRSTKEIYQIILYDASTIQDSHKYEFFPSSEAHSMIFEQQQQQQSWPGQRQTIFLSERIPDNDHTFFPVHARSLSGSFAL